MASSASSSSRLLLRLASKSQQVSGNGAILEQSRRVPVRFVPVRHCASTTAEEPPKPSKGDAIMVELFMEMKTKFLKALAVLRREKFTIDSNDPQAVSRFEEVRKIMRQEAGIKTIGENIQEKIEKFTEGVPDARTYLLRLKEARTFMELPDNLGAEAMMMDALDNVEKQLKKPLLRNDTKGMALLLAEFEKINQKLGVKKEDLQAIEDRLEHHEAVSDLAELESEVQEAMETLKKREEFKDEEIVPVKTLDIRNTI